MTKFMVASLWDDPQGIHILCRLCHRVPGGSMRPQRRAGVMKHHARDEAERLQLPPLQHHSLWGNQLPRWEDTQGTSGEAPQGAELRPPTLTMRVSPPRRQPNRGPEGALSQQHPASLLPDSDSQKLGHNKCLLSRAAEFWSSLLHSNRQVLFLKRALWKRIT